MQRWEREEILGKGTTGDMRTLVEIIIHAHEKSLIRRTRGNSGEAEIRGPPQAECAELGEGSRREIMGALGRR